jgi:AcrR family transcriptional regulator
MSPKEEEVTLNRKEQIMQSAASLFATQGYYKTTTAHVAQAVGVTQPYVFHFFKTKEDLYLAVLEQAYVKLRHAFAGVEAAPLELTEKMGRAFDNLLETHRDEILLLLQCYTTPEPAVLSFAREKFSLIYETVKERYLQAGIPDAAHQASNFISCGLVIVLSEVLGLPQLSPWSDTC